jgi:hypothetical protein
VEKPNEIEECPFARTKPLQLTEDNTIIVDAENDGVFAENEQDAVAESPMLRHRNSKNSILMSTPTKKPIRTAAENESIERTTKKPQLFATERAMEAMSDRLSRGTD